MTPQDHEEQAARMLAYAKIYDGYSPRIAGDCYESAAMHLSAANDVRRAQFAARELSRLASDMLQSEIGGDSYG